MSNTFGNIFKLTTFGESHGEAIGGVIDGMPAGIEVNMDFIQQELNRRRPGQTSSSSRAFSRLPPQCRRMWPSCQTKSYA